MPQLSGVGLTEQARESGKPEQVIEKMIEGRMKKFFEEVTLVNQKFVMNPDVTVGDAAKEAGVEILGYVRLAVGEGIEKEEQDFAAEVAAAALRAEGIDAHCLPLSTRKDVRLGRQLTSGKECVPMMLTLGTLLRRLAEEDDDGQRDPSCTSGHAFGPLGNAQEAQIGPAVEVELDEPVPELRWGMTAYAEIETVR
mgnify:CR=1 FL=1